MRKSRNIHYKVFDRGFKQSTGKYNKLKYKDVSIHKEIDTNLLVVTSYYNSNRISILNQVHGSLVKHVTQANCHELSDADASITNRPGIILGIQTADCCPILLSCEKGSVIGAIHAGWRSAKSGIIQNTISLMRESTDNVINAFIGPTIAQESYEVSKEFYEDFLEEEQLNNLFFIPSTKLNHHMFDLPAYVKFILKQENVNIINKTIDNTYTIKEQYPSYRRSSHTDEQYNSNILSTIMIK
jgi:YfiH family protein